MSVVTKVAYPDRWEERCGRRSAAGHRFAASGHQYFDNPVGADADLASSRLDLGYRR